MRPLTAGPHSAPRGERGVALLIVVGVLAVMAVLAAGLIGALRGEMHATRRMLDDVAADAALEGAMWRAMAHLFDRRAGAARAGWDSAGSVLVGGVEVRIRLRAEAAKLDVNRAEPAQFAALLRAAGAADAEATGLADAIADWRDPDDFRRESGAEQAEYAAAGRPDQPPNRPFADVTEIAGVLGMPADVAACILPDLTVHGGGGSLRLDEASPLMRRAMGLSPATAGALPDAEDRFMAGDVIAVEARIASEDGGDRHARRWILRLTGNMAVPVQVLERRDLGPIENSANAACPPGLGPPRP